MRKLIMLALALSGVTLGSAQAAEDYLAGIPRNEILIAENPQGRIANPGWFNRWVPNHGGSSTGLQQLALDTLWYIDPDAGIDGVWENALASEPPIYNDDFTEMTVKLRPGIYWSDGVEFTADDLIYTVKVQMEHPSMSWGSAFLGSVDTITAPDKYTVVFKLKRPNSRFHANFTVRWGACWMIPKHIFEKADDPSMFDFNPPISLGPYVLKSFDPNGEWYIWQKRDDWQRTTLARFGEPMPKYVAYIDPGPPDKRVIMQQNHQLDIIHDTSPEGAIALIKSSPTSRGWFKGFPIAHPDPTLIAVLFNNQVDMFKDRDVRWALALVLDIKAIDMAAYRGAATISAIGVPPTGLYPGYYFDPLQDWLKDFEIDTGKSKYKPYDPTVGQQIADMLRPSMGDQIPSDPKAIAAAFGYGWWKPNPQVATELLERAGYKKQGNQWMKPDGTPFSITILVEGDPRPVTTRAGTMVAQQWREFGIDAKTQAYPTDFFPRIETGDYEVAIGWSVETWGGHPDLSYFLELVAFGVPEATRRKPTAAQSPALEERRSWTRSSSRFARSASMIPRASNWAKQYIKLAAQEMPNIPLMSYNVFTVMDQTYWTGFPNAEDDPYTDPVPNWSNSRYMMVKLRPTGAK